MRAAYSQVALTPAMTLIALLTLAALTFSVLAGVIEGLGARRSRRRLQRKASPLLHPLPNHGVARRVRQPLAGRALHYVRLFLGFLLATYVGLLLVKAVYVVVARWF